jgi:hypothetical protein
VLKTPASIGFYVGGNQRFRVSVNDCFFGVNIASFLVPTRLNLLKILNYAFTDVERL